MVPAGSTDSFWAQSTASRTQQIVFNTMIETETCAKLAPTDTGSICLGWMKRVEEISMNVRRGCALRCVGAAGSLGFAGSTPRPFRLPTP